MNAKFVEIGTFFVAAMAFTVSIVAIIRNEKQNDAMEKRFEREFSLSQIQVEIDANQVNQEQQTINCVDFHDSFLTISGGQSIFQPIARPPEPKRKIVGQVDGTDELSAEKIFDRLSKLSSAKSYESIMKLGEYAQRLDSFTGKFVEDINSFIYEFRLTLGHMEKFEAYDPSKLVDNRIGLAKLLALIEQNLRSVVLEARKIDTLCVHFLSARN